MQADLEWDNDNANARADDDKRQFRRRMRTKYERFMRRGAWYKVYNLLDKVSFTVKLLVWTSRACPTTVPLDLWQQILDRTNPNGDEISTEELRPYDFFRDVPLYYMTVSSFREENFLALLKWRPRDAATRVDFTYDTRTVLHELCRMPRDDIAMKFRLIAACLQSCPLAAFVHCQLADMERPVTPLNVLKFDLQHAVEWRDMVLEVLPDFLWYRSRFGGTILHELVMCQCDFDVSPEQRSLFADTLVDIARHAAALSSDYLLTNDQNYGTLLHICAMDDRDNHFPWTSEAEVARLAMGLLDICPEFATIPDRMGRLPLHLFCNKYFHFDFVDVIERLLKLHPDAARQRAVVFDCI